MRVWALYGFTEMQESGVEESTHEPLTAHVWHVNLHAVLSRMPCAPEPDDSMCWLPGLRSLACLLHFFDLPPIAS